MARKSEEDTQTVSTISKPYKQMAGAGLHLPDGVWAHKGTVAHYHNVIGLFLHTFYIIYHHLFTDHNKHKFKHSITDKIFVFLIALIFIHL